MNDQQVETWATWLDKSVANDVYLMHLEAARLARDARGHRQERQAQEHRARTSGNGCSTSTPRRKQGRYGGRRTSARTWQVSVGCWSKSGSRLSLTRDWYLDHWGKDESYDEDDKAYWRRAGEGEWAKTFGGEVGNHIDPAVVGADLTELRQGSRKVKHYVNKHVAHFDEGGVGGRPKAPGKKEIELPTLNEVHDAIDLVGRLFRKYHALFTAADVIELTPVLQHDWKAVFQMQWMPELQLPKRARDYQEQREREKAEGKD